MPFLIDLKYREFQYNFNKYLEYNVNDYLFLFTFTRIYLLARAQLTANFWTGNRSQRVCQMNGTDASYMFALRAIMKNSPYKLLLYTFTVSVLIFAYTLKIFDGPISTISG